MRSVYLVSPSVDVTLHSALQESELVLGGHIQLQKASALSSVPSGACDLMIVNCDAIDDRMINELRVTRHAVDIPILLAATQVPVLAYQKLVDLRGIIVLQKPVAPDVVASLVGKALMGQVLSRQSQPRFLTNEPVRVLDTKTGLLMFTRMRNYSPTGAFLEYKGIAIKVGTRLKLDFVNEDRAAKSRLRYDAKVVWIKGGPGESRGVGIQFCNEIAI